MLFQYFQTRVPLRKILLLIYKNFVLVIWMFYYSIYNLLRSDIDSNMDTIDTGLDTDDKDKSLLEPTESKESQLSKTRQRIFLITVLCLQFLTICADSIIFTFFPSVAKKRGLNNTEIGGIFSSFDFSRCITSPIFGSLVRNVYI